MPQLTPMQMRIRAESKKVNEIEQYYKELYDEAIQKRTALMEKYPERLNAPITLKEARRIYGEKQKGSRYIQADLAKALDLSRHTISAYESGKLPIPRHVVLALAYLYGMHHDDLIIPKIRK